jgi:hypothetical protein
MEKQENEAKMLAGQMEKLIHHLESMRIAEYVEMLQRPARLILLNFIGGISRGLGIAIGATLVFALMLEFLRRLICFIFRGLAALLQILFILLNKKTANSDRVDRRLESDERCI